MPGNMSETFIKRVERLIRPMEVGPLHYFQSFTRSMPVALQKKFMKSAEQQSPYLGFVVEPYPLFLFFELTDPDRASTLLPAGFTLTKAAVTEGGTPKYYGIIGSFNAHTSGFWGTRQETYLVAEDDKTGLLTWVIIGIETNTISFEPKLGLRDPNANDAVLTQDAAGTIYLDIATNDKAKQIALTCQTTNARKTKLDQRLWLEGNLSVTYGGQLADQESKPFALVFDPAEVAEGLLIPTSDIHVRTNSVAPSVFAPDIAHAITFPYSQHFVSSSPLSPIRISNKAELIKRYERFATGAPYTAFSVQSLKTGLATALIVSTSISIILTLTLLYQLLLTK